MADRHLLTQGDQDVALEVLAYCHTIVEGASVHLMHAALLQLVVDAVEAAALAGLAWTVPLMAPLLFALQMPQSFFLQAGDQMKIA
mmetsp:Transcript_77195/g.153076  ORF Transcript_77195/g.153076 Transcript_77195/m.153076 type:complete len:86 (-) Transcript_77195:441-698(-)